MVQNKEYMTIKKGAKKWEKSYFHEKRPPKGGSIKLSYYKKYLFSLLFPLPVLYIRERWLVCARSIYIHYLVGNEKS